MKKRYYMFAALIVSVILFALGLVFSVKVIPWEVMKSIVQSFDFGSLRFSKEPRISPVTWILSDPKTTGVTLLIETICLYFASYTPEKIMLKGEQNREERRFKIETINTVPKTNQLIFGVSGSGKSAYIGRSVDEILSANSNAYVLLVDGKGSTEKYSLYYSMQIIAKKCHKNLVLINGTANDSLGGCIYDFLDGIDKPDQAVDLIMSLIQDPSVEESSGSEHYRVMTQAYILRIVTFMFQNGIDVTLSNVLQLMPPENIKSVLDSLPEFDPAARSELEFFVDKNWNDVRANAEKLRMFLAGEGKRIFIGEEGMQRKNIRSSYQNGDIVLVLADEMSMPSLAQKLVQLVAMDLRNLVAGRLNGTIDMNNKVYAYFDEFTSYVAAVPLIRSLYGRARSAEVVMTLATQSCSDIIGLGGGWFDSLVNTADRYIIFRQNGSESPEAAAGIFGTEHAVTATARTRDLQFSGEASNTVAKQFIVHPDVIRNLPVNVGFVYDKRENRITKFRNQFVKENL